MNSLALAIGAITTVPAAGTLLQRSFSHSAEWIAVAAVFAIAAAAVHELRRGQKVLTRAEGISSPVRATPHLQHMSVHFPGTRFHHYWDHLESSD